MTGVSDPLTSKRYWVVINNTRLALMCAFKLPGKTWTDWYKFTPASNWMPNLANTSVLLLCGPPVERKAYVLTPGERYHLLRTDNQLVELRDLDPR